MKKPFRYIPNDILISIFERLDYKSFIKCNQVCKKWFVVQSNTKNIPTILFESLEIPNGINGIFMSHCKNKDFLQYMKNKVEVRNVKYYWLRSHISSTMIELKANTYCENCLILWKYNDKHTKLCCFKSKFSKKINKYLSFTRIIINAHIPYEVFEFLEYQFKNIKTLFINIRFCDSRVMFKYLELTCDTNVFENVKKLNFSKCEKIYFKFLHYSNNTEQIKMLKYFENCNYPLKTMITNNLINQFEPFGRYSYYIFINIDSTDEDTIFHMIPHSYRRTIFIENSCVYHHCFTMHNLVEKLTKYNFNVYYVCDLQGKKKYEEEYFKGLQLKIIDKHDILHFVC
uniref:F-box domain-containing protein n=1 Tax=viral metagenome TaxID=1070528 RepID=A0A6C0JQX2_9ZZZZ